MTIVMGLDQHRAQITAEWIDTDDGRDRAGAGSAGAPGAGAPVPGAVRWRGARGGAGGDDGLAVRGRGAAPRSAPGCIWPSRRRRARCAGNKKRREDRPGGRQASAGAVDDRPAAGVVDPARHILDLRARVRLRHTLVDQRGEWQQRIHAVLYHHGLRHRRDLVLLTADGRAWLEQAAVARDRARADHGRAADDRRARPAAARARSRAARVRAPAGRVQGADGPSTGSVS